MIGVKREEEIELELELSLGGGFSRSEKPVAVANTEPGSDLRGNYLTGEHKREMGALRRQEAKRRRQEKQQRKRTESRNGNGCGVAVDNNNKVWLKSPELELRDCKKSRVTEEEEEEEESGPPPQPRSKMGMENVNLNLTVDQNVELNSRVCPVMYPYPPVQYVKFANGFQYPCLNVVPCWNAGAGAGNDQQNEVQSVVNGSFRLFKSGQEPGHRKAHGCASDQNSRKAGSKGSPVCSSSVVSDYRSSSHEGCGSCDTRSHSSHSIPEEPKFYDSNANDIKVQSQCCASSHLGETARVFGEKSNCSGNCGKPETPLTNAQCSPSTNCRTNFVEQKPPSNAVDCSQQTKPKEGNATELEQISSHNSVSTIENQSPGVLKMDLRKPHKPQTQSQNRHELPQMPCVSTTGNGPNGKTVNGFLYRYTRTEVSIICACHGTSFTPAEFVQHAGGTETSHPLKHITVIPPAF